jgi:hypothetical protein
VIGSFTGAGIFKVDLGGVQASSGETPKSAFSFSGPDFLTEGGLEPAFDSLVETFTPPPIGDLAAPAAPRRQSTRLARPLATTKPDGSRGGTMAIVGLAGLLLLGLIAEGDRRKMRRAQQEIPVT